MRIRKKQQVFETNDDFSKTLPELVQTKKRSYKKKPAKRGRKRKAPPVETPVGDASKNSCDLLTEPSKSDHNMVVKVRLARCKMPYRWREPLPPFVSILSESELFNLPPESADDTAAARISQSVLHRSLSGDEVKDVSQHIPSLQSWAFFKTSTLPNHRRAGSAAPSST